MKFKPARLIPVLICGGVLALVCLLEILPRVANFQVFQRIEWMTYDWRAKIAFHHPAPVATNLAAIFVDEDSLKFINDSFGFKWPWPRKLHGRLVKELKAQSAKAIGFDIFFIERDPDYTETRVQVAPGKLLSSDEYFARQAAEAGNVVLGTPGETVSNRWHALLPAEIFRTNAFAIAHAASERDSDGVLRRAKAFKDDPQQGRIWHLGILLAAFELGLALDEAKVEKDRIVLRSPAGVERVIPLDEEGFFYIDWNLAWNDRRLTKGAFEEVLHMEYLRSTGATNLDSELEGRLAGKLVFIGSLGAGNNISDVGASSREKETFLLSNYWNVANSIMTGRFIRQTPFAFRLLLIVVMGGVSGVLTWKLRTLAASFWVAMLAAAFIGLGVALYVQYRYWLPLVAPMVALWLTHFGLISYRVMFEQKEKRRVRGIFGRIVSPNIVNELLEAEQLSLGGARRKVTVLFTDVRGFTELTDSNQANAEEYAKQHHLTEAETEAYCDDRAREVLQHVNLYLGTVADAVKKHDGTLDKYIGDCVMAFWGAPTPNERHAVCCVRAVMEAQRAIYALNVERAAENKCRERENSDRRQDGLEPLPMLPILSLGSGVNTGVVTVGLMGSESHIVNYTVFGREVNLASRLEGVSGRGRIIIGESTHLEILRDDPELAATCVELAPVTVKGIQNAVRIYEVPWKQTPAAVALAPAPAATEVSPDKS